MPSVAVTLQRASEEPGDCRAPAGPTGPRSAIKIARQIQVDIARRNEEAGTVLGSQQDLSGRYAVGGDTLRDAVRILEFNGVARMRTGPGGGLVVCRPPLELVVASIVGHLLEGGNSGQVSQVRAARASLIIAASRLAVLTTKGRPVGDLAARIRRAAAGSVPPDLVITAADAVGDDCLRIAARALHSLDNILEQPAGPKTLVQSNSIDDALGDLLQLMGDGAATGSLDKAAALLQRHTSRPCGATRLGDPFLSHASPLNRSRVGQVVRTIATEVREGSLGAYLGSEQSLGERYKVSRATIRQALYVLEDAEIVRPQRGRRRGWFACTRTTALPMRQVRAYLSSLAVDPALARRSADTWRQVVARQAPNPLVEFIANTFDAYAGSDAEQRSNARARTPSW